MSKFANPKFKGRVFYVPVDVATMPKEGWCFVDRFWTVHPEKGVAFYYRPFGAGRSEEPSPHEGSLDNAGF